MWACQHTAPWVQIACNQHLCMLKTTNEVVWTTSAV